MDEMPFVVLQEMSFCLQHTHTKTVALENTCSDPTNRSSYLDSRVEENKSRFNETYYGEGLAHEYLLRFMTFAQDASLVYERQTLLYKIDCYSS